jgi:hypothetical protein
MIPVTYSKKEIRDNSRYLKLEKYEIGDAGQDLISRR